VEAVIERDWPQFVEHARRLQLGEPTRDGIRIDMLVQPAGTDERFRAVLRCDGYDGQAPLLDFADVEDAMQLGRAHWPRMANAPMNAIEFEGRYLPIICTAGTRGYHLHQSHVAEVHEPGAWRLARVATLLAYRRARPRPVRSLLPGGGRGNGSGAGWGACCRGREQHGG
jgi:hypothetical protein